MKQKDNEMETIISKSLAGTVKEKTFESMVKDIDTTKGIVTIYINGFNIKDSDGDISLPGSFKRTFKNNLKILQHWLNHERNFMIGFPLELKEDDYGAMAISQLNLEKQLPKDVFSDYKILAAHERTLQHSVRVLPMKYEEEGEGDDYVRRVSEWKLIQEYSTVYGWGANQNTPMIDIKSLDDLEIMIREGDYSDEKAKLIEDTYKKLKHLLDSDSTPDEDPDPETLDSDAEKIKRFYSLIKI